MGPNTMIGALAVNCRAARESKGVSLAMIAANAGVSEGVIRTFEQGESWPKKVEEIVDTYAVALGKAAWRMWADAASIMGDDS
jgi:ribosome-binding protein aMBF1 (putative translation factor)